MGGRKSCFEIQELGVQQRLRELFRADIDNASTGSCDVPAPLLRVGGSVQVEEAGGVGRGRGPSVHLVFAHSWADSWEDGQ